MTTDPQPRVSIIIPVYNEEAILQTAVVDLIDRLQEFDWTYELCLAENGSTDRTVEVARELGVDHIVSHRHNRGLAAAFMTGIDACLRAGADIIVNTDADNQYRGASIPDLVEPVQCEVAWGHTWSEALDDIQWAPGDLLVVGSSSLAPLARVFLGSRATKILRHSPVPVIAVPRARSREAEPS